MLSIPVGATVTRVYYTLPSHVGHIGPEFDNQHDANVEALRRWGANQSHLAINAPTVQQRMVFTFPSGGGLDTVVDTETVYPNLTTPPPSGHEQRAALAETAIRQLEKFHGIATQVLATTAATN